MNKMICLLLGALPLLGQSFVFPLGVSSSASSSSSRACSNALGSKQHWRLAATGQPVVEELAGRKPKYVVMEDSKGHTINTTMVAVSKLPHLQIRLSTHDR